MKLTVNEIIKICDGILLNGSLDTIFETYSLDTRFLNKGDVYLGVRGEVFDGNDFIDKAFDNGAIAAIIDKDLDSTLVKKYADKTIIKVKDTVLAMQKLASYMRDKYDIPVIAITGSVGKTSTKDIVASVVSQKYKVLKTEGNLNNKTGLPLTLFKLDNHEAIVVEMGMSQKGEITTLSKVVKPTLAIITNIGTAHIGNLGSRENILKAKLEIIDYLKDGGKLLINNDNDLLNAWNNENKKDFVCTYGIEEASNFMAKNIVQNETSSSFEVDENKITVPVFGKHFIYNALCAYSVGKLLGIDTDKIVQGIANFKLTSKRMEINKFSNNISVIEDYYNASYESMSTALNVLGTMTNKTKIAVLGDMLELGDFSKELHEKVGKEVVKNHVDLLITVGKEAKHIANQAKELGQENIYICENNQQAINILKKFLKQNVAILIKASHGMNFGEIAQGLKELIK